MPCLQQLRVADIIKQNIHIMSISVDKTKKIHV